MYSRFNAVWIVRYIWLRMNKNALEFWRNGIELRVLNWPACLHSGASVHQQVKYLESFFGAV